MPMALYEGKFELPELPPMALYLLYAVLKDNGYDVTVVDPYEFIEFEGKKSEGGLIAICYEYLKSKISEDDIVCFSANSFTWGISKEIANKISENNQEQKIIFGGLHPTLFDEHVLKVTNASLVVRGEGEKKLLYVIDAMINRKSLSKIKGITYRRGSKIIRNPDELRLTEEELGESPLPDFSVVPVVAKYKYMPIEASRGCKFSCAFCSITNKSMWKGISVDSLEHRVCDIMKYKHMFYPGENIVFMDDCFTADGERAKEIIFRIKDYLGNSKICIEVRATDVLRSDLFDNINKDIIMWLQIGVECGYNEGLKRIKKGLTLELLYAALDKLVENGFSKKMFLSFIIGFPWEGLEDINKTLDTIEDISARFGIACNVNWLWFLPSALWDERERYGIMVNEQIFDDAYWVASEFNFYRTHPLVSENIIIHVHKRVWKMVECGLPVNLNMPFFMSEKLIIKGECIVLSKERADIITSIFEEDLVRAKELSTLEANKAVEEINKLKPGHGFTLDELIEYSKSTQWLEFKEFDPVALWLGL